MHRVFRTVAIAMLLSAAACASAPPVAPVTAPRYPDYPMPDVPAGLAAGFELRDRHETAWRRLQSGDLRGAARDFGRLVETAPDFYPARAGLGFVDLAEGEFEDASRHFRAAIDANQEYVPAWQGLAETQLELDQEIDAIHSLERVVALDPAQAGLQARIELLRFRHVQSLIGSARRDQAAGRLTEARGLLEQAIELSPGSAILHEQLAEIEQGLGTLESAEQHARRAVELEPQSAAAHARLGSVLEARGRLTDAAEAYERAIALEPRASWRERAADLRTRARLETLPPEFGSLPTAATVTRAQVAALVGLRLEPLIASAPRRVSAVATDVRGHWAAPWILPVTQAGVMEIFPNHTFQPSQPVRRGDLARVVQELLVLGARGGRPDLRRWTEARPAFVDLPADNLFYRPAATAVAAGVMTAADDQFRPIQPATGPELLAAVSRIEQILGR